MRPHDTAATRPVWKRPGWRWTMLIGVLAVGVLGGFPLLQAKQSPESVHGLPHGSDRAAAIDGSEPVAVQVVQPWNEGLPGEVVQTGTIEPSETAELHARVSGLLRAVHVDIGDQVQPGQVLAEIDAPELQKDVQRYEALLEQARQRVRQARAELKTIESTRVAAEGAVRRALADVERTVAERSLREKEFARIETLVAQRSIEPKIADERLHRLDSARAGEESARASQAIALAELTELEARIDQARADVAGAEADVRVSAAELERAEVLAGYTRVTAPFAGVVVHRNVDRGDFVHSAAKGAAEPLLTIARLDRVRAVVRIPDGDVGLVRPGCEASVRIEALGGIVRDGIVSRVSRQQDRRTRTMRAEIDLSNPDGLLAGGMYGKVTIHTPPAPGRLTVPNECLLARPEGDRADVYVLRDGRVDRRSIRVGRASGRRIEILDGLSPEDLVVSRRTPSRELHAGCLAVPTP